MQTEKKLTGYPSIDKPWLKYYSEEVINAQLPECTIYEYLWENNKDHLDDVALIYFGRKITYGELIDNIEKAAKALYALGIKQGDIVVMATVTTPETIYAFYGLNRIGAIANMVDPRTSTEGIKEYIEEVNAEYVLSIDVAYPKIENAIIGTSVKKVIVTSPADSLPQPKKCLFNISNRLKGAKPKLSEKCLRWDNFISNGGNAKPNYASYQKDTCCVIVHTGGTTGTPKGVMLSNDNLNHSAYQCYICGLDFQRKHKWLNIMPPFIAYGVGNGLHLPLVVGMEVVLIPQFDPKKYADLLLKHKPNHMVGVPSHYENIVYNPKLKNKSLSFIISPIVGGDTMDTKLEELTNDFLQKHNCTAKIVKGYGMTEVSAAVSVCGVREANKIGSVGIPFSHTVISVFDVESGKEIVNGQNGEVCIRTTNMMLGYYGNKMETDKVLKMHDDGELWVHSGDIGYMDKDGALFIIDRIKRMIVRHDGFKVFPHMIETTIISHTAVESCCAVGILDKDHSQGKLPMINIVLKTEYEEKESNVKQELISLCKKELPEYAQPVKYIFLDKLPLTNIGKIDFRKLEKEAEKIEED